MTHNRDSFRLAVPVNSTDHILGPHSAAVMLVEYGDFECPDCKRIYQATRMLVEHFGNRIGFVFRHFPLTEIHPHAELAAEVAEVAAAQGRFWEMHAKLFKHQGHFTDKHFRDYARELELDMTRYDAELGDHIYLQRVQEHIQGAKQSGVRGTPSFFLNSAIQDASAGIEPLMQRVRAALDGRPHART